MEIRSTFLHLLTYVRAEGSSDFNEHTAGMRTCLGSIALHCLIRRFLSERTFIMVVILYISALKGVHCSSSPSDWVGKVASGIHRMGDVPDILRKTSSNGPDEHRTPATCLQNRHDFFMSLRKSRCNVQLRSIYFAKIACLAITRTAVHLTEFVTYNLCFVVGDSRSQSLFCMLPSLSTPVIVSSYK